MKGLRRVEQSSLTTLSLLPSVSLTFLSLLFLSAATHTELQGNDTGVSRTSRFLNLFSVIRFSNTPCVGSGSPDSRNGTCYTEKECGQRNGQPVGSCAGGFGVCCSFSVGCGQTTRENCSYLTTDLSSPACLYTVCRMTPHVTLLRLDFTEFDIAQPFTCGASTESVACTTSDGPLMGDCLTDTFTVTSPGTASPPVICGYNTGQHMYVPVSEMCNKIAFNMDLSTTSTRKWNIKVSQYDSSQDLRFLPDPSCLQWNYGLTAGTIQNFNFESTSSTHLSSQHYSICWRRERGKCNICFAVGAFGISNVPSTVPSTSTGSTDWTKLAGMTDSICCSKDNPTANCETSGANDFIEIPGAVEPPAGDAFAVGDASRFCGRWFGIAPPTTSVPSYTYSAVNAAKTICTNQVPFRLRVQFSDGEVLSSTSANVCGTTRATAATADVSDECGIFRLHGQRKGNMGFQLKWWQVDC